MSFNITQILNDTLKIQLINSLDKTILNVRDFGAVGDGITNDTAAFEEAEKALPPEGGYIYIPHGTYIVAYRIRKPNVHLIGSGIHSVLKTQPNAEKLLTDCPLRIFADHCSVRNLKIDGNAENNSHLNTAALAREADGIGIYANYCVVDNVWVDNCLGHHIIVWNEKFEDENHPSGARHDNIVMNSRITRPGLRNSFDFASTHDLGDDFENNINYNNKMINNYVEGQLVIHTGWDTLIINNTVIGNISCHTGCRRLHIDNNKVYGGIIVQGGLDTYGVVEARRSRDCKISNNEVYDSSGTGIRVANTDNFVIDGNVVNGTTSQGIMVSKSNKTIVSNNVVKRHKFEGIYFDNGCIEAIISNNLLDNSESESNYSSIISFAQNTKIIDNNLFKGTDGIRVESNSIIKQNILRDQSRYGIRTNGDARIIGNEIFNSGTQTILISGNEVAVKDNYMSGTYRGINISGSYSGIVIVNNKIETPSNKIDGIQSDTVIKGNLGFRTENTGTAEITQSNTEVTVFHRLDVMPLINNIMVTPLNDLADSTKFWLSDVTATTFKINVDVPPTNGRALFAWKIDNEVMFL